MISSQDGNGRRLDLALSLAIVASAAFSRPLVFWAENAWDLSSTIKPVLFGIASLIIALAAHALLLRTTGQPIPNAIGLALGLLVLVHWRRFEFPFLLIGFTVFVGIGAVFLSSKVRMGVAAVFIAVFGISPILQVVISHITKAESYPIVELAPHSPVEATGRWRTSSLLLSTLTRHWRSVGDGSDMTRSTLPQT